MLKSLIISLAILIGGGSLPPVDIYPPTDQCQSDLFAAINDALDRERAGLITPAIRRSIVLEAMLSFYRCRGIHFVVPAQSTNPEVM